MAFMCFIVKIWWNWTTQFHKFGILNKTNLLFWKELKPDLNLRQCIEIFASSKEFHKLFFFVNKLTLTEKYEIKILKKKINENSILKNIQSCKDCAILFLYAHMHLSINDLPICLKPFMDYFLREAPKLLDVMIDCSLQRSFIQTGINLLELKQHFIQRQKFGEKDIVQLPYYQENFALILKKFKINSLKDFICLEQKELENVLNDMRKKNLLNSKIEILNFKLGITMFPIIEVYHSIRTLNEDTIYKYDIISTT